MRERGIIMSGPMVLAIPDGRKTQTRRVMRKQPGPGAMRWNGRRWEMHMGYPHGHDVPISPYGVVSDRLYVREAWRVGAWDQDKGKISVDYRADNYSRQEWLRVEVAYEPDDETFTRYWIQSTDEARAAGRPLDENDNYHWKPGESPCRWRSARYMPRWASRYLLEITDIRVERVQEISPYDALCEGIDLPVPHGCDVHPPPPEWKQWNEKQRDAWAEGQARTTYFARCADADDHINAFRELWDSINEKRGYGWEQNPWVWKVAFKLLESNDG